MAIEIGTGSKPVADTKTAAKQAAAKSTSTSTKSAAASGSTAVKSAASSGTSKSSTSTPQQSLVSSSGSGSSSSKPKSAASAGSSLVSSAGSGSSSSSSKPSGNPANVDSKYSNPVNNSATGTKSVTPKSAASLGSSATKSAASSGTKSTGVNSSLVSGSSGSSSGGPTAYKPSGNPANVDSKNSSSTNNTASSGQRAAGNIASSAPNTSGLTWYPTSSNADRFYEDMYPPKSANSSLQQGKDEQKIQRVAAPPAPTPTRPVTNQPTTAPKTGGLTFIPSSNDTDSWYKGMFPAAAAPKTNGLTFTPTSTDIDSLYKGMFPAVPPKSATSTLDAETAEQAIQRIIDGQAKATNAATPNTNLSSYTLTDLTGLSTPKPVQSPKTSPVVSGDSIFSQFYQQPNVLTNYTPTKADPYAGIPSLDLGMAFDPILTGITPKLADTATGIQLPAAMPPDIQAMINRGLSNVGPVMTPGLTEKTGNLFVDTVASYKDRLMSDLNLTDYQAAAVLGNLGTESDGFKAFNEYGGGPGIGWAQWTTPARKAAFTEFTKDNGLDIKSEEASYQFLVHEIQNRPDLLPGGKSTLSNLQNAANLTEATKSFMKDYEAPGVPNLSSRLAYAQQANNVQPGVSSVVYSEDPLIAKLPAYVGSGNPANQGVPKTSQNTVGTGTSFSELQQFNKSGSTPTNPAFGQVKGIYDEVPAKPVTSTRQPTGDEIETTVLNNVKDLLTGSKVDLKSLTEKEQKDLLFALPRLQQMDQMQALDYLKSNNLYDVLIRAVPDKKAGFLEKSIGGVDRIPLGIEEWGLPTGGDPNALVGAWNDIVEKANAPITETKPGIPSQNTVGTGTSFDELQRFAQSGQPIVQPKSSSSVKPAWTNVPTGTSSLQDQREEQRFLQELSRIKGVTVNTPQTVAKPAASGSPYNQTGNANYTNYPSYPSEQGQLISADPAVDGLPPEQRTVIVRTDGTVVEVPKAGTAEMPRTYTPYPLAYPDTPKALPPNQTSGNPRNTNGYPISIVPELPASVGGLPMPAPLIPGVVEQKPQSTAKPAWGATVPKINTPTGPRVVAPGVIEQGIPQDIGLGAGVPLPRPRPATPVGTTVYREMPDGTIVPITKGGVLPPTEERPTSILPGVDLPGIGGFIQDINKATNNSSGSFKTGVDNLLYNVMRGGDFNAPETATHVGKNGYLYRQESDGSYTNVGRTGSIANTYSQESRDEQARDKTRSLVSTSGQGSSNNQQNPGPGNGGGSNPYGLTDAEIQAIIDYINSQQGTPTPTVPTVPTTPTVPPLDMGMGLFENINVGNVNSGNGSGGNQQLMATAVGQAKLNIDMGMGSPSDYALLQQYGAQYGY